MVEHVYDTFDEKMVRFSSYYIIYNNRIYKTDNENYDKQLKNCYYIVKLGSNIKNKLVVKQKSNYEWLPETKILYSLDELINLICENEDNYICMRGFSRSLIGRINIRMKLLKNKNIGLSNSLDEEANLGVLENKKPDIPYCKRRTSLGFALELKDKLTKIMSLNLTDNEKKEKVIELLIEYGLLEKEDIKIKKIDMEKINL